MPTIASTCRPCPTKTGSTPPSPGSTTAASSIATPTSDWLSLALRYQSIRRATIDLCEPLGVEDYVVQTMTDVSPTKWHLAHTSWFFETFILSEYAKDYRPIDPRYRELFNSYYKGIGESHARNRRGVLTRPTVEQVFEYRRHVDAHIVKLLEPLDAADKPRVEQLIELGLNHEQQHQELILTDIKYVFSCNPLRPAYRSDLPIATAAAGPPVSALPAGAAAATALHWRSFEGGLREIGHTNGGFAYDCESPRHRVFIEPFALATRTVTNGEFAAFINDGGYTRPALWLSDGWDTVESEGWSAPLYWEKRGRAWQIFTLGGMRQLNADEPVCHLSFYEADAYARWAGARLPTEAEWETVACDVAIDGNFAKRGLLHPEPASDSAKLSAGVAGLFGDVWEWTASAFRPYPGYQPLGGALGEYNGKFMSNQMVLRGGSCLTPQLHIRSTYRNFFPPDSRWQMTGLRLAKDD